jgi:hypothetical protein
MHPHLSHTTLTTHHTQPTRDEHISYTHTHHTNTPCRPGLCRETPCAHLQSVSDGAQGLANAGRPLCHGEDKCSKPTQATLVSTMAGLSLGRETLGVTAFNKTKWETFHILESVSGSDSVNHTPQH